MTCCLSGIQAVQVGVQPAFWQMKLFQNCLEANFPSIAYCGSYI